MKEIVIQVPEGKKAEWINGVLTLVDDDSRDIIERIKTFDDAREYLGEQHLFVREYTHVESMQEASENIKMYLRLRIIVTALNENWRPKYTEGERRYSLIFVEYKTSEINNTDEETEKGFVFAKLNGEIKAFKPDYVYGRNERGPGLYLRSEKLAQYACKQFWSEWIQFLRS